MGYVWTPEQVDRYAGYYKAVSTHHAAAWASFSVSEEYVRSVLPPCLEPSAEPTVTVSFGAFMEWLHGVPNRPGRDRAALIGVGARRGQQDGVYYLTVIEEEEVNIATGREFWGMPKKQGTVDFYEDGERFYGFAARKGFQLIELQAELSEPEEVSDEPETEIYFELRGHFGPQATGLTSPELVVFETINTTTSLRPFTDVQIALGASPLDPGVGEIPLGGLQNGGLGGGQTAYEVREVIDLSGDGYDYAPYLLGRLYDDWPDICTHEGRVVGALPAGAR